MRPRDPASGFEVRPRRPAVATLALFVVVVIGAASFAHAFREGIRRVIRWYGGSIDPTAVASHRSTVAVVAGVALAVIAGGTISLAVGRRWRGRIGIEAIADSARGGGEPISLTATTARSAATWLASIGLTSIGRESAIIETGGALGSVLGRRTGGRGDTLAATGIVAGFAAAYHAPVAAVLYAEEHLGVGRSRRATTFVIAAAAATHLWAVYVLDSHGIFPAAPGTWWQTIVPGLAVALPAVVCSRWFLRARAGASGGRLARSLPVPRWMAVATLALVSAAAVAWFPAAAGNGMEGMRHGATAITWQLAAGLLIGKAVGTTAALGAGAAGGVLSPTMGVAGGAAMVTLLVGNTLGWHSSQPYGAVLAAMAIGVAVGLEAPLMAVVLIPEMVGDYRLMVPIGAVVGVAVLLNMLLSRAIAAWAGPTATTGLPAGVRDEDG